MESGHVGGIRARSWDQTNFAENAKKRFFSKKQRKNFAACEICRTFAPSKKITYLGLRIGCIPLTLVGITDCGSNPHMHAIDNYFLINLNKMKKTTLLQKAVFMAYILAGVIFAEHPEVIIPVFISGIYLCHRGFFGKE